MSSQLPEPKANRSIVVLAYSLMLGTTAVIYLVIRSIGDQLAAPAPIVGQPVFNNGRAPDHVDGIFHVLLALMVVIVLARMVATIFRQFHQPPVVGEILAGIMLGPSLLGRVWPAGYAYLLPTTVAPFLNIIAQVGVILYMFLVGLELDPSLLRKRGHVTVAISHTSIIVPFILGAALALFIYPVLGSSDVPFTSFSLFLGVSMSVTAFPVLARILTDRRIHKTRMGVIALTCAAVDDVTAWCLLALVVGIVQARTHGAMITMALAAAYIATMIWIMRPAMVHLSRAYGNRGRLTQGVMTIVFVALLLSALTTDLIGIHAIFGAFALGAIIPHDSGLARDLTDRLEDVLIVLLLPAFFAFTGMRTQIGLVSGASQWIICGLIVAVASIGKFGGTCVAARATGLGWRESSALGVLMNTRGLMELIVLNIGFELHVISPELFAMLVLMALVTTFATTPVLHFMAPGERLDLAAEERSIEPEERRDYASTTATDRGVAHKDVQNSGVMVAVSNPSGVAPLLNLAFAMTRPNDPPPHIAALVLRPPGGIRSGLRELDDRVAPRSAAMTLALEHAQAVGESATHEVVWSDAAAEDILNIAARRKPEWLLLGSHRPIFGADFSGGVVRQVLDKADALSVHVAIVVDSGETERGSVFVVIDDTIHGHAALDLAIRAAKRKFWKVHALLVPGRARASEGNLMDIVREGSRRLGHRIHADVLANRDATQIGMQTPGAFVIVGSNLITELGLPVEAADKTSRSIIVVQGAQKRPASERKGVSGFHAIRN
ncbi:MAG TPA: cation:proton antiporter [Candidatus Binataceae bacterium]|nr:cation:proton antiporter [Candidatus Binataceae bacterium]